MSWSLFRMENRMQNVFLFSISDLCRSVFGSQHVHFHIWNSTKFSCFVTSIGKCTNCWIHCVDRPDPPAYLGQYNAIQEEKKNLSQIKFNWFTAHKFKSSSSKRNATQSKYVILNQRYVSLFFYLYYSPFSISNCIMIVCMHIRCDSFFCAARKVHENGIGYTMKFRNEHPKVYCMHIFFLLSWFTAQCKKKENKTKKKLTKRKRNACMIHANRLCY